MVVLHETKYEPAETCPAELKSRAIRRNALSIVGYVICLAALEALMIYIWITMPDTCWLVLAVVIALFFACSAYTNLVRINRLKNNKFGRKEAEVSVYKSEYVSPFKLGSSWAIKRYVRNAEVDGEYASSEDSILMNGDKVYLIEVFETRLPASFARFTLKRKDSDGK